MVTFTSYVNITYWDTELAAICVTYAIEYRNTEVNDFEECDNSRLFQVAGNITNDNYGQLHDSNA